MYCVLLMFYLVCFERHEVVVSSFLLHIVFLALLKISWCAHLTTVLHNKYTAVWCVWCVRGWCVRGWWGGEELQITNTVKEQGCHRISLHGSKTVISL